jgi:hypothetical protein
MQMIVRLFLILVAVSVFAAAGVFILSFIARIVMPH